MSVSVLTYARETTVDYGGDLLVNLDTFASGLGWATELQQSVTWDLVSPGVYGWAAGDDDFLEIKSTGYGSQQLVYRFRWEHVSATAGTRGILWYTIIDPNNPTYSTVSSTWPHLQNRVNINDSYSRMSLPDATFTDGVYFFGSSRFIAVIIGLYSDAVASFAVGLPDLLPELQSSLDISCLFPGVYFGSSMTTYWWDYLKSNPTYWKMVWGYVGTANTYQWYQRSAQGGIANQIASNIYSNNNTAPVGDLASLRYLVKQNTFSDKRIGAQPTLFGKDETTGLWHAIGVPPFIIIPYGGLSINGTITYGSEVFRVFPLTLQAYNYGLAFRTS